MKSKAWPKGDRKALCHRFSNARAGLKDREAERQWDEVAQVIHSIGFGSFCDRRHADEEEQPVLVHLTRGIKNGCPQNVQAVWIR